MASRKVQFKMSEVSGSVAAAVKKTAKCPTSFFKT
jgi:hypothetical protein